MRTLATVLAVVLVNDAVLLVLLDATPPGMTVVLGGTLVLAATVLAAVSVTGDDEASPPSRQELQENVEALCERVDQLEGEDA